MPKIVRIQMHRETEGATDVERHEDRPCRPSIGYPNQIGGYMSRYRIALAKGELTDDEAVIGFDPP